MKRQLLLSLSLSILAANAFALPAADLHLSAESRSGSIGTSQPLDPVAEGGSDRLIERNDRIAEGGSDRLIERNDRIAEGGSDRLVERNGRIAEGGSDRLVEISRAG